MGTTFLIGNGLGMALDPEAFSLKNAMENAWNKVIENSDHKRSFVNLFGLHKAPEEENDLRDMEAILKHAKERNINVDNEVKLLAKKFSYTVANSFLDTEPNNDTFNTKYPNFRPFINRLSKFITNNPGSTIATLNYDWLLYLAFNESGTFRSLVDGFWKGGVFSPRECTNSKGNMAYGWFLHLHGSPLYFNDTQGTVCKRNVNWKLDTDDKWKQHQNWIDSTSESHLVLTHPYFKDTIIQRSKVLRKYWREFDNSLKGNDRVIIIGYGGQDPHINRTIHNNLEKHPNKKAEIIEWDANRSYDSTLRKLYWQAMFEVKHPEQIIINLMPNILEYDFNV